MIGEKIRAVRKQKDLTLNDLSNLTDLTPSYISQIERNIIDPSISSLRKISSALGMPLYVFLTDDNEQHQVIRVDQRKKIKYPSTNISYDLISPLTSELNEEVKMMGIHFKLKPDKWLSDDFIIHDAHELLYVIEGELTIFLEEKKFVLKEGDSIYIKGKVAHNMYNSGDMVLKGISCISDPL